MQADDVATSVKLPNLLGRYPKVASQRLRRHAVLCHQATHRIVVSNRS
jgi:hypothetical protein